MATYVSTPKLSSPTLQTLCNYKFPMSSITLSHCNKLPIFGNFTSFSPNPGRICSRRFNAAVRAESTNGSEPVRNYDFDLFTIGAGSGGVRASRFAANYGASVAVCELPFATISSDTTGGVGGTLVTFPFVKR